VSIWNHDDLSIGSVYGIYNSNEVYGKWVLIDNKGNVKLPVIKTVKLEGLTLDEAKDTLSSIYGEFIKDPIIEIKVLNLQVTILGEVKSPGIYILEKNENHLIELIGRSGGLNDYANSSKVKIIRGDLPRGETQTIMIDLTDVSEIETGKMNIYPNDIIYISSKKGKMLDKKAPTLIPFASALSAIAIITAIVFKKD
jgi:polysaccharide export outer membrane protein